MPRKRKKPRSFKKKPLVRVNESSYTARLQPKDDREACEQLMSFDEGRRATYDAVKGRFSRALQAYAQACQAAAQALEVELESALANLRPMEAEAPTVMWGAIWDGLDDEGQAAINARREERGLMKKITRKSLRMMLATAKAELANVQKGK